MAQQLDVSSPGIVIGSVPQITKFEQNYQEIKDKIVNYNLTNNIYGLDPIEKIIPVVSINVDSSLKYISNIGILNQSEKPDLLITLESQQDREKTLKSEIKDIGIIDNSSSLHSRYQQI